MIVLQLTCAYVVAVCPRPLVLQPSLPTYVCSFASPRAATATTDVVPCIPSSTMIGSPVPNVLWSPRSTNVVTVVTQGAGINFSASQSVSESTLQSSHIMPPVNRSRTFSDNSYDQRQPGVQPLLKSASCGTSKVSRSQQQIDCISPISLELVTCLPADIVKSLLESDSSRQSVEMLVETLSAVQSGSLDLLDTDAVQQLANSPQLASIVKELRSSRFEAEMTEQDVGSWKSLTGLLQQTANKTRAFSSPGDSAQSELDVSGCQCSMRSLGQLGQAPAHQLEGQAFNRYWYVFL